MIYLFIIRSLRTSIDGGNTATVLACSPHSLIFLAPLISNSNTIIFSYPYFMLHYLLI